MLKTRIPATVASTRLVLGTIAVTLGAAAVAATAGTAAADPLDPATPATPVAATQPVPVYQIPATALAVSGLVVPGPYFAQVQAQSIGSGEVSISAPASDSICATSAGSSLVQVDWFSLTTARSGSATVKPCPNYIDPSPVSATINPGAGPVVMLVRVTGSPLYPGAGQPSLPGVGTFGAI